METMSEKAQNSSTSETSYLDRLSPRAQVALKRFMGIGVSFYICRVIVTSPEFKYAMKRLNKWGKAKIPASLRSVHSDSIANYYEGTRFSLLLQLPGKVRRAIWSKLSFSDLQNVRLVCKRFQWDVDYVVGVHAFIDSRTQSFDWFKTVAIRKCTIHHLKNLKDWDFLGKPHTVSTLKMNDICAITPEILGVILGKCVNLRNLSVHFRDDGFSNDGKNLQIFKILEGQQRNRRFSLVLLNVTYIPAYRTCHWVMKFKRPGKITTKEDLNNDMDTQQLDPAATTTVFSENVELKWNDDEDLDLTLPSDTKYVFLNFEHYSGFDGLSYSKNRFFWKKFLENQLNLKIMICNFGPVCWDVYAQVIRRNYESLEKISLSNVGCWDFWDVAADRECPFNWNFFAGCEKLRYLSIASENGPRFGPSTYTPMKPISMHLKVLNCNFGLVYWGIYMSIVVANLNTLEDITLLRMTNWDKSSSDEAKFDWNIFSQCASLRNLVIGGEHLIFLETINFESIPTQRLRKFQLFWIALISEEVRFMVKYMPDLENTFEFLDWCSIDKIYRSEDSKDLVKRFQGQQDWFQYACNLKRFVTALPLVEIAATTWLFLVKPDV